MINAFLKEIVTKISFLFCLKILKIKVNKCILLISYEKEEVLIAIS